VKLRGVLRIWCQTDRFRKPRPQVGLAASLEPAESIQRCADRHPQQPVAWPLHVLVHLCPTQPHILGDVFGICPGSGDPVGDSGHLPAMLFEDLGLCSTAGHDRFSLSIVAGVWLASGSRVPRDPVMSYRRLGGDGRDTLVSRPGQRLISTCRWAGRSDRGSLG
jgi:hypothetical protein